MRSSIYRIAMAVALVAFAVPLLVFVARTGWAAWRVTPELWMGMSPSTSDTALLRAVRALAPGEASYPSFIAIALLERARATTDPTQRASLLSDAAKSAQRATELMPTNPRHHRLVGSIAITRAQMQQITAQEREQQVQLATRQMHAARERFPNSPLIHQQAGLELLRGWEILDEPGRKETLEALRAAATLEPSRVSANLVVLRGSLGLERTLELMALATPDGGGAWLTTARELESWAQRSADPRVADRLRQEALSAYGEAVERGDLGAEPISAWASAWQRLAAQDQQAFVQAAQAIQRRHPRRPTAWLALAGALRRAEETEKAGDALDRAVVLAREPEAVEEESDVASVLPQALQRRAEHLFGAQEYESALADYAELTELQPRDTTWWIRKARCLGALDRPDEALRAYETAVRRAPRSAGARAVLADAYLARFEFLDAITQWRAIVARRPEDIGFRLRIARTYGQMGLSDQAIRYYSEVLDRDPNNGAARREMNLLLGVTR